MVAVAVEPFFTTYTNSYIKEKKIETSERKHSRFQVKLFGRNEGKVGLILEKGFSPVHAFYIPRADAKRR